jgi:predicted amidohydrolase
MNRTIVPVLIVCLLLQTTSIGQDQQQPATVRVASISFEPVKFDLAGNTKSLKSWFRKAAAGGAKLAVAPEGALEGYVVDSIIAKEVDADRMHDVAVSIDSPTIKTFQILASELDMCLVFGFAEKTDDDVYNCAVFIDNSGNICGKYHKMQLAEGYHDSWWFNRLGKQSRAFDTPLGRCGVLICNDRWNPLLAKIPALDGAQFLVIPSFGSKSKSQDDAVLARGVESGVPVVEANVGVSLIVSNDRVAAVDRRREGITFAQISIPASRSVNHAERDRVEAEFLRWRKDEMPIRLAERMKRIEEKDAVGSP